MGLVDGHLWILVAVEEEHWGIVFVHVENGAGEAGEIGDFVGLGAEEQVEGGFADTEAVGSGLVENRGEVGGAEEADDALDIGGLVAEIAEVAFKFAMAVGDADESGEMSARGRAGDNDLFGVDAEFLSVGAKVANGGFDVVNLRGKFRDGGESVINGGDGATEIDEVLERHFFF